MSNYKLANSDKKTAKTHKISFKLTPAIIVAIVYLVVAALFFFDAATSDYNAYKFPFTDYGGTFKYPYAHIGSLSISLYWTMHVLGIFGMIFLCLYRRKRFGYSRFFSILTGILLAVFGFIGAKILFILENWDSFIKNGLTLGGVSFFGTVYFMPLAIPLIAFVARKKPLEYLDYCTPAGLVMLTAIRTGCFLNGCCQGIFFMLNDHPVRIPAQLIECALDCILLQIVFNKEKKIRRGLTYFVFMGGYGVLRFFTEFIRVEGQRTLGMRNGQLFALIAAVISFAILFLGSRKKGAK